MALNCAFLLGMFMACSMLSDSADAAIVTIYWEGTISDVFEFTPGAAPAGVADGAYIYGSVSFENTQSTSRSELMGNVATGPIYRFGDPLLITFSVGPSEWRLRGGEVGLLDLSDGPQHGIEVTSRSDSGRVELFPKEVGPFEASYILIDDVVPLRLFDVEEIVDATIDPLQVTKGSGILTSRHFEGNDITDGYYISFKINRASPAPIPEPSGFAFVAASLFTLGIVRSRRSGTRNFR